MSMRKQFIKTVTKVFSADKKTVLLLGDIGVFGFSDLFKEYPDRTFNIGILEPTTISLAAGIAKSELTPIVHTIAPFLVERAYEQLKIDFGYQRLGGNFVSVGASYDYAALGCTHHCPADVAILQNIPGMEIVVPGTASEFDSLFCQAYRNQQPTYFRLSESENMQTYPVEFGKAHVIKTGKLATVIAIGPTLNYIMPAVANMDISVIYYTTLAPFDSNTLRDHISEIDCPKVMLVEPFYAGTLTDAVLKALFPRPVVITSLGVPKAFLTNYGTAEEHDIQLGFTSHNLKLQLEALIAEK